MQALNGNAVSLRRGFRFAAARWRAVLLWSLFAGLVGYLINAIESRLGALGRLVRRFGQLFEIDEDRHVIFQ